MLETLFQIHLYGAATAIVMQVVLVLVLRYKMGRTLQMLDVLTAAARRYDLYVDFYNSRLISFKLKKEIGISRSITAPKLFQWGVVFQSLILGWLNCLVIGSGLLAAIGTKKDFNLPTPRDMVEFEQEVKLLKDPQCPPEMIADTLKDLTTANINQAFAFAEIRSFIDAHFPRKAYSSSWL